ncbi:unnamed protein product [Sympodiomycopsis kandeliae]
MDPEAGPSTSSANASPSPSQTLFKKKKKSRPAGVVTATRPADILADDDDDNNESKKQQPQDGNDDEQADDKDEERLSVADLIALRNLNRKPTGIELDKLNKGVMKKKKKKNNKQTSTASTEEDRWKEQMAKGGLVQPGQMPSQASNSKAGGGSDSDSDSDDDQSTPKGKRRRVRQDNFQGETNVIDVDKHMMAYIEAEMLKRRGETTSDPKSVSSSDITSVLSNPEDELYKVAEKYTRLQSEARNAATANKLIANKSRPDDEEGEGNVGLSSAMLSGIPEVELGMDSRLKNIEETEKAKRTLYEQRKLNRDHQGKEADDLLANARFFNPKRQIQSDAQVLAEEKRKAEEQERIKNEGYQQEQPQQRYSNSNHRGPKRETATDDQVMQRFKKRQMNNMKR